MVTASQIIAKAKSYVGYEEKASAKDLNAFHANVGNKNYQKFQPLAGAGNGDEWCQYFVDGVFVEVSGSIRAAEDLLCMDKSSSMTGYTPTGRLYFVRAGRYYTTPEPGDIVYFYSYAKGRVGHTGIVISVDKNARTFETVEGNTSSTTYAENGGCVARHSYGYANVGGYNRVNGFGRPRYQTANEEVTNIPMPFIMRGSVGKAVYVWQAILGFKGKDLDGDFGPNTEAKTKEFQRAHGLEVDGKVGTNSWRAGLKSV